MNLFKRILGNNEPVKKQVIPLEEIIFSVDNFNIWFLHPKNGAVYANPGIYLRLDKLSQSHISDYLEKCYRIENPAFLFSRPANEMISDFEKKIRQDWSQKLSMFFPKDGDERS